MSDENPGRDLRIERICELQNSIERLEFREDELKRAVAALEDRAKVAADEVVMMNPGVLRSLGQAQILLDDEIVKQSISRETISGIYFLIEGKDIVYVGQSTDVLARMVSHQHGTKGFDRFAYMPIIPEFLDGIEAIYINRIQPKLNKCVPSVINKCRPNVRTLHEHRFTNEDITQKLAERTAEGKNP